MSASTDFNADEFGVDPLARPRVFRRRSTVIFSLVFAVAAVVVGLLIGLREIDHGLVGAATIVGAIPLVVLALIMGVSPRVVLHKDHLEVHNSVFWFEAPYVSIAELKPTRLGLVVRTYSGKLIPVAAYASGSGKRMLGHADAADDLTRAVQERTAFVDDSSWRDAPPPRRHLEKLNVIALVGSLALAVVMIVLAANG
jgi:hypothetical protein